MIWEIISWSFLGAGLAVMAGGLIRDARVRRAGRGVPVVQGPDLPANVHAAAHVDTRGES